MLAAVGVKALARSDAAAGFQAAGRIVQPAVNDLVVARRGLEPDCVGSFDDEHVQPGQGECSNSRKPDDAGTDNHAFNLVHYFPPSGS